MYMEFSSKVFRWGTGWMSLLFVEFLWLWLCLLAIPNHGSRGVNGFVSNPLDTRPNRRISSVGTTSEMLAAASGKTTNTTTATTIERHGNTSPLLVNGRQSTNSESWTQKWDEEKWILESFLPRKDDDDELLSIREIRIASRGLATWKQAWKQGRLPDFNDFENDETWPSPPLYDLIWQACQSLQVPRFVNKHQTMMPLLLRSLLRLEMEFSRQLKERQEDYPAKEDEDEQGEKDDDFFFQQWKQEFEQQNRQQQQKQQRQQMQHTTNNDEEELLSIAQGVVQKMWREEWGGVIQGVGILDSLWGLDHGLLSEDDERGIGYQDGIWSHTGWKEIPKLQRELEDMKEMQELLQTLGRRPSTQNSDRLQRFLPRKNYPQGVLGAEMDTRHKEHVQGITQTGNLAEILPSEALGLCGERNSTSTRTLRRLFLARLVEQQLWSYHRVGWTDIPSRPSPKRRHASRLPSAPGGPLILCLDTSWSMSGRREVLSKAVVLACVQASFRQRRDCQVVAFSKGGLMDVGPIMTTSQDPFQRKQSLTLLLEFLRNSFEGGTDVTGALKYVLQEMQEDLRMTTADILLVTDGEIPDPPVSDDMMQALETLRVKHGTEIHGLLIGKSESVPLSKICTQTHNFLSQHETKFLGDRFGNTLNSQGGGSSLSVFSNRSSKSPPSHRFSTALAARRRKSWDDDDDDHDVRSDNKPTRRSTHTEIERKQPKSVYINDIDDDMEHSCSSSLSTLDEEEESDEIERHVQQLKEKARADLASSPFAPSQDLETERNRNFHQLGTQVPSEIRAAIDRIESGLVERGDEARLVVLSMMAGEHILLLGSPGTAKSVLGQRLAELCGGFFFQRLLTRFTTPEELFGPLSLKSLEQDEYRRCTEGFLPTADIAFLDEIFKANSAILNTLLTILNERKFDNGGGHHRESCPIRCVVGASNELPDSDDLVALFDRFLIRKEVLPVSEDGVLQLLTLPRPGVAFCEGESPQSPECLDIFTDNLDTIIQDLQATAESVVLDRNVAIFLRDLRNYLRQELAVELSDRRLVKAARLLKLLAASDGRSQVDYLDLLLLEHVVWDLPEQRALIQEWLWDHVGRTPVDELTQFQYLLENLRREIITALPSTADFSRRSSFLQECQEIQNLLTRNQEQLQRHIQVLSNNHAYLWLDTNRLQSMRQMLLPKAEAISQKVTEMLLNVKALELSISSDEDSFSGDTRIMILQSLWDEDAMSLDTSFFTPEELDLTMRQAKARYDLETFRRWKRTKKKEISVKQ